MNTAQVIELSELFQRTFGHKPYVIAKDGALTTDVSDPYKLAGSNSNGLIEFTPKGSVYKETYHGVSVVLPVRFYDLGSNLLMYLPFCVVRVSAKKTIIKTPLVERGGSVKEQYNIDDYSIQIKGFLIAQDRKFPELELDTMRKLFETNDTVLMENALTNIFLQPTGLDRANMRRVAIENVEFPEVTGGKHVFPYVMNLCSDTVFTLEWEDLK